MSSITKVFKALSDNNRLKVVITLLHKEELCVCDVLEIMGVAGATASKHMGILIEAGIVKSRKDSKWVHYTLQKENSFINEVITILREDEESQKIWDEIDLKSKKEEKQSCTSKTC